MRDHLWPHYVDGGSHGFFAVFARLRLNRYVWCTANDTPFNNGSLCHGQNQSNCITVQLC